jgi:hypothetical protein
MSHIAVITVKVVAEAPVVDHGDTEARPKPEPSARRINENVAAAKAPPKIAGQLIADIEDSSVLLDSERRGLRYDQLQVH